jgi:hypothetical protein
LTKESTSKPDTSPPIPDDTLEVEVEVVEELLVLEVRELNEVTYNHPLILIISSNPIKT